MKFFQQGCVCSLSGLYIVFQVPFFTAVTRFVGGRMGGVRSVIPGDAEVRMMLVDLAVLHKPLAKALCGNQGGARGLNMHAELKLFFFLFFRHCVV